MNEAQSRNFCPTTMAQMTCAREFFLVKDLGLKDLRADSLVTVSAGLVAQARVHVYSLLL